MADTKEAVKPHVGGAHGEEDADAGLNQALLSAAGEGDAEKVLSTQRRLSEEESWAEKTGRGGRQGRGECGNGEAAGVRAPSTRCLARDHV